MNTKIIAVVVFVLVAVIATTIIVLQKKSPLKVKYVKVSSAKGSINLAEIKVMAGDTNIALGKTATASSVYNDNNAAFGPAFLINGILTDKYVSKDSIASWVKIDLGTPVTIDSLVVYNRTDGNQSAIVGKVIEILDESEKVISSFTISKQNATYTFRVDDSGKMTSTATT
jgi:hypothetical protein